MPLLSLCFSFGDIQTRCIYANKISILYSIVSVEQCIWFKTNRIGLEVEIRLSEYILLIGYADPALACDSAELKYVDCIEEWGFEAINLNRMFSSEHLKLYPIL
jgi:hypothetical protein